MKTKNYALQSYVRTILESIYKNEKYKYNSVEDLTRNDGENDGLLKQLILELSCKFNSDICRKISNALIERWKLKPEEEWSEM